MEEKENKIKKLRYNKRDNIDDSKLSVNSDVLYGKYNENDKDNTGDNNIENNHKSIIEEETKNHIDEMKKGSYNILVAVRSRPLSQKEKQFSDFEIVKILDKKMIILIDPYEYNAPTDIFKNRSREQQYAFDFAFDNNCSQEDVFNSTTRFLLDGVVNGYNATVFAYGATGAGKTYTMLGHEEEKGIMFLTLEELFNKINSNSVDRDYKIKLWYLEIYNENIKDLLSPNDENCDLREDPQKGTIVSNISELSVSTSKDIMNLLRKGNKNRTQEATNANETSSRSHAILQVLIEYKEKVTGLDAEIKIGKLSLIDLAGSERAKETLNKGLRLIEGANINRSLLTLGNCINALCEASEKGTKPYIPYRDSKLTRLLKDSLGGNSRTVMIANVSPAVSTFGDTYNTLKYANRAKNIKTHVTRNTTNVQYHISNYNQIISNLKNEITDLKGQLVKKDYSLNNIVHPNKTIENKKDDFNHKENHNHNTQKLNNIFEKAVSELKAHCENEILVKQKIIDMKMEVRKLNQIVKSKKNEYSSKNNISKSNRKEKNPNEKEDETINIDEKDNINQNNSVISNSQMININNSVGDSSIDINLTNSKENKEQKILEAKLLIAMKNSEKYSEGFKEMMNKRELLMNKYSENGIKEFHYEYLESILKAHNLKLFIIENRFKEKFENNLSEIKENYISALEEQMKIRDDLIKKNNLDESLENIKSLRQLKNDYTNKLPMIPNKHHLVKDVNASLDTNLSFLSGRNLPLINRSNNNLQSMLNDIKSVNNNISNISRIENDPKNNNNNLSRIDQKNKFKSEVSNKLDLIGNNNNNLKMKLKKSIQGVKNSNPYANNNNNKNDNSAILNSYNNLSSNINTSNGSNIQNIHIQNKNIQGKYITNNNNYSYSRKSKQLKLNLINPKIKETHSEKSDSNNLSNEIDSYIVDQDNSINESRLRNLKNRRSAQPKIKEEHLYSPLRNVDKKNQNPTSLRKVVDNIPQIKKKDLNIFLNEKNKYKNQRKMNIFK